MHDEHVTMGLDVRDAVRNLDDNSEYEMLELPSPFKEPNGGRLLISAGFDWNVDTVPEYLTMQLQSPTTEAAAECGNVMARIGGFNIEMSLESAKELLVQLAAAVYDAAVQSIHDS